MAHIKIWGDSKADRVNCLNLSGELQLLLSLSDLDGMPLSLLEAMSYGNCCVVSDIEECAEVVEDKAVVFPKSDVKALRASLQTLCDNEELVNGYKQTAADFICDKYSWDDAAKKTLDIYIRSNN